MQAAPFFAAIGTALGAGGAGAAATGAAVVGTAVSTIGTVAALSLQASAASQAAAVEEANAKRVLAAGRISAQDADFEFAAMLSAEKADQAASGVLVNSGSYARRQSRQRVIGRTNRLRIINDAEAQAASARNRASANRTEAKGFKLQSAFGMLEGSLGIGSDLISGAALSREGAVGSTNRQTIGI